MLLFKIKLSSLSDRVAHQRDLEALVGEATRTWDRYVLQDALQAAGVPQIMLRQHLQTGAAIRQYPVAGDIGGNVGPGHLTGGHGRPQMIQLHRQKPGQRLVRVPMAPLAWR